MSSLKGLGVLEKQQTFKLLLIFYFWPVSSVSLLWLKGELGLSIALAFKGCFQESFVINEGFPISVLLI